jgi:hypothetical protein
MVLKARYHRYCDTNSRETNKRRDVTRMMSDASYYPSSNCNRSHKDAKYEKNPISQTLFDNSKYLEYTHDHCCEYKNR